MIRDYALRDLLFNLVPEWGAFLCAHPCNCVHYNRREKRLEFIYIFRYDGGLHGRLFIDWVPSEHRSTYRGIFERVSGGTVMQTLSASEFVEKLDEYAVTSNLYRGYTSKPKHLYHAYNSVKGLV